MAADRIFDSRTMRAHCSVAAVRRGLGYARSEAVLRLLVSDRWVHASVQGRRPEPYVVRVGRSPVESSCACPMVSGCKHVAAVMMVAREPGGESELPSPRHGEIPMPPREAGAELYLWCEAYLPESLWEASLREVVYPSGFGVEERLWWRQTSWAGIPDVAAGDHGAPKQVVDALLSRFDQLVDEGTRRRRYVERATGWRASPPAEACLKPLWERATSWFNAEARGPSSAPGWGSVNVSTTDGDVVCEIRPVGQWHRWLLVADDLDHAGWLQVQARERHLVAGALLDGLLGPEGDAAARDALVTALAVPRWKRLLAPLNDLPETFGDAPAEVRGWKLEHRADLRLSPAVLTPYKRRSGFRTKKVAVSKREHVAGDHRGDHAAVAELRGGYPGAVVRAVHALIGHPRVVGADGELILVREGTVVVHASDEQGMSLKVRVDGRHLSPEEVRELLGSCQAGLAVHLDPARHRVSVVELADEAARILRTIGRLPDELPPEAVHAVVQLVPRLELHLPVQLSGSLRGERLPPDTRPLVRLSPVGDEGLYVEVRVRPLEGGPCFPPGHGPEEPSRVVDGARTWVRRSLEREPDQVRRALADVPLPELDSWRGQVDALEPALALVAGLEAAADAVMVEWPADRNRVSRSATANDLTVRAGTGKQWFAVEGELVVDGDTVPLAELLRAMRGGRRFIRVQGKRWVQISESLQEQLLLASRASVDTPGQGVGLPPLALLRALGPLEDAGAQVTLPAVARELEARIVAAEHLDMALPEGLCATLRPYQVDGYRWLRRMAHWSPGACLADDMGLGKTLQSLALLLHRAPEGPALVVAPASVNLNWLREAERFAPGLVMAAYRGPSRAARLATLGAGRVLVTSYELMVRDAEALSAIGFSTVIFDEAQALKNPGTRRSKAAASLGGAFTLALSGTPIENRTGDAWSLFRVIAPGLLGGPKAFRTRFSAPIEQDGDLETRAALASLLRPFLLRRLKTQVATELPARQEHVEWVRLSPSERTAYDRLRVSAAAAAEAGSAERMQVLAALQRLRQLACATALVDPDAARDSTKLARLRELLLIARANGAQALVFSGFVQLLKLAREGLEELGFRVAWLDGSTPLAKRQTEIDAFQAGERDVFLISLKAGGTGLNLTAASYVFHLDPWWNPAAEDQATDRAHRIGQDKPVTVYRLVSADTVEEQVLALHARKRELASALIDGKGGTGRALSSAELVTLLRGGAVEATAESGPPTLPRIGGPYGAPQPPSSSAMPSS